VDCYQLHNAADIASKMVGKAKATKTKASKVAKVAVLKTKAVVSKPKAAVVDDGSVATLDVQEIDNDAELESLKAELGLSESYSE